jgi:hypothetical protein
MCRGLCHFENFISMSKSPLPDATEDNPFVARDLDDEDDSEQDSDSVRGHLGDIGDIPSKPLSKARYPFEAATRLFGASHSSPRPDSLLSPFPVHFLIYPSSSLAYSFHSILFYSMLTLKITSI